MWSTFEVEPDITISGRKVRIILDSGFASVSVDVIVYNKYVILIFCFSPVSTASGANSAMHIMLVYISTHSSTTENLDGDLHW